MVYQYNGNGRTFTVRIGVLVYFYVGPCNTYMHMQWICSHNCTDLIYTNEIVSGLLTASVRCIFSQLSCQQPVRQLIRNINSGCS